MNGKLLSSEKMSVGYHGVPLIKDIALALDSGEIVTLIGPNGAGKSTILKSLAGQLKLIAGDVRIEDVSILHMSEKEIARKTAVVFTERPATELISVREVVSLGRYPYTDVMGTLKDTDRFMVQSAMEAVGITEISDREFSELSDGQKQRVLLARAICQEPALLILDEPTSFLDIRYKIEFLSILQRLSRNRNIGVLLSLHELDLAERISDRIICVNNDRIEAFGTVQEIFKAGFAEKLYGMEQGTFDIYTGSAELERPEGKSQVFVIAGNNTGIFTFRELQRKGIPFSAGILSENDLDCPAAEALAQKVISVAAYDSFSEADYEAAKTEMFSCRKLICCQKKFGEQNIMNLRLLQAARDAGMEIRT